MKGMRRARIAAPPMLVVIIASSLTLWWNSKINDASAGWRLLQSYDDTDKSVGNWGLADLPGNSLREFGGAVLLFKF